MQTLTAVTKTKEWGLPLLETLWTHLPLFFHRKEKNVFISTDLSRNMSIVKTLNQEN